MRGRSRSMRTTVRNRKLEARVSRYNAERGSFENEECSIEMDF